MMFIMATFVHRQEQLEAVNREVKHFVYSKKKKNFTSFRLHAFRLFSRLFAKPKYLHESCCDFFILVLTCELLKKIKNIKVYLMFKLIKDFDLFHSAVHLTTKHC